MAAETPVWRSLLFVPVNVPKFVESAHRRGSDAVILDLEDSVPPAEKAKARGLVPAAAGQVSAAGADVVVRINRPWRLAVRDIEAAVCARVAALALPKTPDAGHVHAIAEVLDEVEAEHGLARGHTRLIAMIETPEALGRAFEIAAAHPRLVAMILGGEDFSLAVGGEPTPEALLAPNQQVLFAARAAGITPLGFAGSIAEYDDEARFRAIIRQARELGFAGAFCIHPKQVATCNAGFAPTPEEAAEAEAMIAAYDEAQREGRGAVVFRGRMIDEPVVDRARRTLALHRRIAARQSAAAAQG
ncbi:MAG TPA: CoA ester lyase [Alphaproteobacteria bacterium]|nr:CoA ester lyase [Alphaproteobacteria bacterium]